MKTLIPRVVCPLYVLIGCVSVGNLALAQGAAKDASSGSQGGSTSHTVGRGAGPKDVLDHPRLLTGVSIERNETTVEQALEKLSGFTPIHLIAEGTELRQTMLLFHYTNMPLRDILASLAAVGDWEWIWKDEQTLVLKERSHPHVFTVYPTRQETLKDVYERGAEFLGQVGQLSPALQNALGAEDPPQGNGKLPGVSFGTLPPAMQDTVRAMLEAHRNDVLTRGGESRFSAEDLPRSTVMLQAVAQKGDYHSYEVVLSTDPSGGAAIGTGMSFRVLPEDHKAPGGLAPDVANRNTVQDARSRQTALTDNPHLRDKVSLHLEKASLFQALKALSAKTDLSFLGQSLPEREKPVQKTFSLPAMPLGEMLDRLTALYSGQYNGKRYRYTWGQPNNQVFIFHLSEEMIPRD